MIRGFHYSKVAGGDTGHGQRRGCCPPPTAIWETKI